MIGIDTNILVRYFVKDDPVQTPAAVRVIYELSPNEPGWLALTVVAELAWTLRRSYRMDRTAIADIIEKLLDSKDMVIEQRDTVRKAVLKYRECRAGFADCLIAIAARASGCDLIVTFDRIASRDLGMLLVE